MLPDCSSILDSGLGKTSIILAALKVLKAKGLMRSALIVAPLRVCYSVWPAEIQKWSDFRDLTYAILHGPGKEIAAQSQRDIYIVNPDGFEWLFTKTKLNVDVLIIDESTTLKRPATKRFKLLKPQLNRFKRRYILTGTPAPNGYMDLFGQIYILDQGNALGRYITHFRNQYFFQSGFGDYDWRLVPGAEKLIEQQIAPLTMRLSAEDYLDMPALINNTILVDLPAKAQKLYKELEDEFLITLERGQVVTALNAASASVKARQLCSGGIYFQRDDGRRDFERVHDAKLDAAEGLVEELGGKPVIIVYEFEHDLERLLERFGKETPWLGGGVSPKRALDIEFQWNAGEVPILLGHARSLGHGLNLQSVGNTIIWFSIPWDLELYEQTIRRLYRQGQKERHVFVHHLIARSTIDEVILKAVGRKSADQRSLLDALREYGRTKRANWRGAL